MKFNRWNASVTIVISVFLLFCGRSMTMHAQANTFDDITGHWAKPTINWAINLGIANGYPDGTFKPDREVSEAEFLVMFLKAYSVKLDSPTEMGHWADAYYDYAVSMNYPFRGTNNYDIRNEPVLRGTVAELISAADGANFTGQHAVIYLIGKGYSAGAVPDSITIENFKSGNKLTRAEAVQLIKNVQEKGLKVLQPNPIVPSNPNQLPDLPVSLPPLHSRILDAINGELKEGGYEGYEVNDSVESIVIFKYNVKKVTVDFSDTSVHPIISLWDVEDPKAIAITLTIAKADGRLLFAEEVINKMRDFIGKGSKVIVISF